MLVFITRRLLLLVPVMLIVASMVFALIHLTPGDPTTAMLGQDASQEQVEELRHKLGLDLPLHLQFLTWLGRAMRGDLGDSLFLKKPVLQCITRSLEPTVVLTVLATLLAVGLGVPLGIAAALKRNSIWDQAFMFLAVIGVSMPNFWLGILLMLFFAVKLSLLPVMGYSPLHEGVLTTLKFMILPAVSLGFRNSALIARMMRGNMLDILRQDYIRTARAKGLAERVVVIKHVLKNSLIATVTVIGFTVAAHLGGSVVTETIFGLPGVGRLMVQSIFRRDYVVVQGAVLMIAASYVLVNLLVDVAYVYIDPRIKYT